MLADAGVEPPATFEEMIALGPKLKEAGVVPLAQGGEPWQERLLFNSVMISDGGSDLYLEVLGKRTSTPSEATASARSPRGSPSSGTWSTKAAPGASGTTPPTW